MTTEEIYLEMMSAFAKETGMEASSSCDLAVRFYAVAAQIYSLYAQADWVRLQCFPQTATGQYLDYHAQMRGLSRREASCSTGVIRFYMDTPLDSDLLISSGTICMTAGLVRFETTEQGVMKSGSTFVEVPARAVSEGSTGNVGAGSILYMSVAPVGISRCGNPAAFSGGADDEDDDALRERILETYRRLPNGANAAYYEQQAMTFDEVAAVTVVPRSRGIGTVDIVISTSSGTPSDELLKEMQVYFEACREIAVDVEVKVPTLQTVDVSIQVKVKSGYELQQVITDVKNAISAYYDGSRLGEHVLRAKLGALVFGVDGVENYTITAPTSDITIESTVLPLLGTLTVTAAEVA